MHEVLEEALKDTNEKDAKGCRELPPKTSTFRLYTAAPASETRTARCAGATRSNGTLKRWRTSAATLWPSVTTELRVRAAIATHATTSQARMRPSLHPPTHTRAALLGETPRYKLIFHATVGENQLQVRTCDLIRARRKFCRRLARGAPARRRRERRRERARAVRRACASRRVASGTRSTTNARPPPFPTAASTLQPSASLYSLNECATATQTTAQAPVTTMCVPLDFAPAAASGPIIGALRSHSFTHSISLLVASLDL